MPEIDPKPFLYQKQVTILNDTGGSPTKSLVLILEGLEAFVQFFRLFFGHLRIENIYASEEDPGISEQPCGLP